MSYFEYRVVPAPKSLPRMKGVKTAEGRFAVSMGEALNAEGRDGWEFQSTETIETEVKGGFLSKKKLEKLSVLVFRRWVEIEAHDSVLPEPAGRYVPDPTSRDPEPTPAPISTLSARRDDPHKGSAPPLSPARRD